MSFEEKFPSLKSKRFDYIYYYDFPTNDYNNEGLYIYTEDVEKYCLDKAIVDIKINKIRNNLKRKWVTKEKVKEEILKWKKIDAHGIFEPMIDDLFKRLVL